MDSELFVPYGMDPEGVLVKAVEADRATTYCCPGCSSPLVLHAGERVIRHFAHKANTSCTGETIAHKTAKALLVQTIIAQSSAHESNSISIACPCSSCETSFILSLPASSLTSAHEEVPVAEYICDVVAFRGTEPVLAIEVLVTHEVGQAKATALPLPWIELRAEDVLENPYLWRSIAGEMKPVVCLDCKTHGRKLNTLSDKWGQPIFEPARQHNGNLTGYRSAIEVCWSCKQEILVYWWPGVPFCEAEPPNPRPKTVQLRNSKQFGGSYWANTCPSCKSIQGDNFLFLSSKAPFRGLPLRDTPEMKAQRAETMNKHINHMFRHIGR